MQKFHNILYVSHGLGDDSEALPQAFSIARISQAELKALIVCPGLPGELAAYQEKYVHSLVQQLSASVQAARGHTGADATQFPVEIEVECGSMPAERIVRHVLKHAHGLVLKEAERKEGARGFMAIDMELLRKCPCPVWLSRSSGRGWRDRNVAVAIDPEIREPEGQDLSLRLLQLSRSIADTCTGHLTVVSCWDYPFEDYLRDSPWVRMQGDELASEVSKTCNRHRAALHRVVRRSGIGGKIELYHVRGGADRMIPLAVADRTIDVLVMGTVARTGIPGFIIGNTAENVVQKLECSLLALKPAGFVSPVKAY